MRALLDINVLIAALDAQHAHHERANAWLAAHAAKGWASCPITENGCVRVMSQPAYPNALPAAAVIERLALATRHPSHRFWPDDVSLLDGRVADGARVLGPRQVTDLYLVALAVRHGGRLATFDGAIPFVVVHGAARRHVAVI